MGDCTPVKLDQIPTAASGVALTFVEALYSYDVQRIAKLVEPARRDEFTKEAFNGPNAEPVRLKGPVRITLGANCGRTLQLTTIVPAEYRGQAQYHIVTLTLRRTANSWLVSNMAADYDASPEELSKAGVR